MSSFQNEGIDYLDLEKGLFDAIQIGTLRVSVPHQHAGTKVHDIRTILFQSIYQTVLSCPNSFHM
ncbi:MAG: hypothetical protein WB014_14790 [Methanosarcina sp.]